MKMKSVWVLALGVGIGGVCIKTGQAVSGGGGLPAAVETAVRGVVPGGRVDHFEVTRRIITLYEVSMEVDGEERQVTLTGDGGVLEIEEEVEVKGLPAPVREALGRLGRESRVDEVERVEVLGVLRVVRLDEPRVEFEADVRMRDGERAVRLSEDGNHVALGGKVHGRENP